MKIVIAGVSEVGSHLAKLLSKEEQDVILVDADAEKLAAIDANYNLMTNCGSPTSFTVLSEAGVAQCDLFIAVTPFETTNVIACSIAKNLGAKRQWRALTTMSLWNSATALSSMLSALTI